MQFVPELTHGVSNEANTSRRCGLLGQAYNLAGCSIVLLDKRGQCRNRGVRTVGGREFRAASSRDLTINMSKVEWNCNVEYEHW